MSSSFPFYSQTVREHLFEILSHREQSVDDEARNQRHVAAGSTLLGRRYRGDSSAFPDDDSAIADDVSDIEEERRSSSGGEESSSNESDIDEDGLGDVSYNASEAIRAKMPKCNNGKKRSNDISKEQLLQKMHGKAPLITLPLPQSQVVDAAKRRGKALQIPTILLPPNYIRDNPNWEIASVARSLLDTWDNLTSSSHNNSSSATIIIVLLQSGRFAAAVYTLKASSTTQQQQLTMIAHKTSTRYTVRKGQGGSQSAHDSSKHKAKSIGAQLRREGEKQLRDDVQSTWKLWKEEYPHYINDAVGIYVSCPKGMRRDYLFGGGGDSRSDNLALVKKSDERLRNIPLDVGRPTLETVRVALECLLSCGVVELDDNLTVSNDFDDGDDDGGGGKALAVVEKRKESESPGAIADKDKDDDGPSFTPLHTAVIEGDLSKLMELLTLLEEAEERNDGGGDETTAETTAVENAAVPCYDVNTQGGPNHQTPLHLASASNHPNAPLLLNALLINGHANPCAIDSRGRPPYFVASSDRVREAFRLARGALGEEYCKWDDEAKVGPALNDADVQAKKVKALEKKRKQRARQKEKKALQKAQEEDEAAKERQEEEKKKQMEEAKRIRDGLKPKTSAASNVCDFCQQLAKVKRRSEMFQRLEYVYCSTECVKKHQRELMAAAAAARMGG